MPLSSGDKLGPYEILLPIGAGGMGEVYRAHDSRLNRDVAIKVSAGRFSDRFSREVHAVAALNHPNVCTLHDVGANYLVMELIEGPTLAERIAHGAIPLEEALGIARQIAAALEAAHDKGIVHRDLKPGNIKIKPDGTVKVLDFGLAKVLEASAAASSVDSPTVSMAATQAGVILGTAAYMAPEQARGKVVDKRADIWAFGVVLHEMLTGKRLFEGEDLTETLASVVKERPDLSDVPAPARRLIERCLEKDPKKRLRDIGDMELLLADTPAAVAAARPRPLPWIATASVMTAVAAVALWAPWRVEKPVERPLVRLDVDLGEDVSLPAPASSWNSVAISPDGTRLVYASGTPTKLFTRRLDQPRAAELPGTQGADYPFFSPDGQWVGFATGGKLNKISVEGGAVVPVGDVRDFGGASWGEDGNIIGSELAGKGLLRFPAAGGAAETVAGLGKGEAVIEPQVLPGGKAILFTAKTAGDVDHYTIEVLSLADGHRKIVARGGASPRYVAAAGRLGHLIYVNKATMFAVPFDLDKLETRGTPVPVLDDVAYDAVTGTGQFDVSGGPDGHGVLVYRRAGPGASAMFTLQWVDPAGKKEPLPLKPGGYRIPKVSPDGKRVALMANVGGSTDIWVYDPRRDAMTRLTFDGGSDHFPTWTPDGRYVVFESVGKGIFQAPADGGSKPQALLEGKEEEAPWSFTPDGKRLAYCELTGGKFQIWTVPVEEQGGRLKAGNPEQFLKSGFDDTDPVFSPDGHWVAYRSNESGKKEVYVRAFPQPSAGSGGKWQISNSGGTGPQWSGNGHDLLYRSGDQLMAVSYTVNGDAFVAGKPRLWIANSGANELGWDSAPDGKRVLTLAPVGSTEAPKPEHEVVFLENFFDYLRQKAPVK